MGTRTLLKLLAAVIAALAMLPLTICGAAPSGRRNVVYHLDLGEDPLRPRVRMELRGWDGEVRLTLPASHGRGLVTDLFSHVRDLRAYDGDGREIPVSANGNVVSLSCPGDAALEYSLDLEGYRSGSDYLQGLSTFSPWPYFPIAGDYVYLPGYAAFLVPEGEEVPCQVRFSLPEGWASAGPASEEDLVTGDLLRDPVLAGRLTRIENGNLEVIYPSEESRHLGLDELAKKAGALLAELEAYLPSAGEPGKTYVFVLPWEDGSGEVSPLIAEPFYRTVALFLPPETSPLSDQVLGEFSRQAAGIFIRRCADFSDDALWFREGLAWYLMDILPYRAGLWGSSTTWDRMLRQYRSYEDVSGAVSLSQAGTAEYPGERESAMLCHGGAIACAAMDAELQAPTPGNTDILRFLELLSSSAGERGANPVTSQDILDLLSSHTGKNWKPFFDRYVSGRETIPASAFSSLDVAPRDERAVQPIRTGSPGLAKWTALILAVLVVFALPFFLEPYTLRPRKEGFLERVLRE